MRVPRMTKEEATRIVDALIDAAELALVVDSDKSIATAEALRDNLRCYVIDMLMLHDYPVYPITTTSPATTYRTVPTCQVGDHNE